MMITAKSRKRRTEEMAREYDFSGRKGVRGKYHRAFAQGYVVKVLRADGAVEIRTYPPEKGSVMIEPDLRRRFPDSQSVNAALRSLVSLTPSKKTGHRTISRAR